MPIRDYQCKECGACRIDVFQWHFDDPAPPCEACGGAQAQLVSNFATVYMGSVHKYMDLNREGGHMDGFWAYKKRSSVSGQPEPVYLDSMQAVKEFNRAEGLAAPGEVPTNATISADGRRIESRGMKGQWGSGMPSIPARLQEMIDMPDDQIEQAPATARPCMPADYGIRAERAAAPKEVGG